MIKHLTRMVFITLLIVLCTLRPFLPGNYDGLAMPLSTMAQAFGVVGMLLVPVGVESSSSTTHWMSKGSSVTPHGFFS